VRTEKKNEENERRKRATSSLYPHGNKDRDAQNEDCSLSSSEHRKDKNALRENKTVEKE
jgi:hypothetical protein